MPDLFDRRPPPDASTLRSLSQGVADGMLSAAELRVQVDRLQRVVEQLVYCQVRGEPLALHEEPFRTWLGLPVGISAEAAMEHLWRSRAKVLGTSACPACGAQVQDKEGILDEVCPWCGAKLQTER
jgi:hypothetical protein